MSGTGGEADIPLRRFDCSLMTKGHRLPNSNALGDGFSPLNTLVIAAKMPRPKLGVGNEAT